MFREACFVGTLYTAWLSRPDDPSHSEECRSLKRQSFRPHFLCPTAGGAGKGSQSPACYPSLYRASRYQHPYRESAAHTGIGLDSILMESTHVNSLKPDRHCYSKTCRGGMSPKTTVYSMNFILLFYYLKTEAKWHGWKYSVKRTKWINHSTGN